MLGLDIRFWLHMQVVRPTAAAAAPQRQFLGPAANVIKLQPLTILRLHI